MSLDRKMPSCCSPVGVLKCDARWHPPSSAGIASIPPDLQGAATRMPESSWSSPPLAVVSENTRGDECCCSRPPQCWPFPSHVAGHTTPSRCSSTIMTIPQVSGS